MRKWKVTLPGGRTVTVESDDPGRALIAQGHTAFSLEEITPPPPIPEVAGISPEGRLTLSVDEAAAELGICSRNVYTLAHRRDFPAVRIGNRIRISREGLRAWVLTQAQNNNGGIAL